MSARFTIADLPPKFQAQIAAQLAGGKPIGMARAAEVAKIEIVPHADKKRIRQHAGDGMNNWEREYAAKLAAQYPGCAIHREVSLPLANGLRYKVDFLVAVHDKESGKASVFGYEVKGLARSTGIAKAKMAARIFPWILFTLATKRRKKHGGGWSEETVLP